jgi:hypothetical protein
MTIADLLREGPIAVSVGVRDFARDLKDQQVDVVEIDWRPPRPADAEMQRLLEKLL